MSDCYRCHDGGSMCVCLCAEAEQLRAQLAAVTRERDEALALLDAPPYVDCVCTGCPRKVPQAWASGMCEPCSAEDCEHTDGATAMAARAMELRLQLDEALRAERFMAEQSAAECNARLAAEAERDQATRERDENDAAHVRRVLLHGIEITRLTRKHDRLRAALEDLLGWDQCECGHPACERGAAAGRARALLREHQADERDQGGDERDEHPHQYGPGGGAGKGEG